MTANLDIGRVFNRIFELYTSQASIYLPTALILYIPAAIITGAILTGTASVLLVLLSVAVGLVTAFVYQGVVVQSVNDLRDGQRDLSVGELFSSVVPVLGMLIAVGLVGGLAEGVGFLLLVVPGVFLVTVWAVVAPAVVIERKGFDAFGRSYELVRGNFWQVLGVIVILFILQFVVQRILAAIGGGISDSLAVYAIFVLIASGVVAPPPRPPTPSWQPPATSPVRPGCSRALRSATRPRPRSSSPGSTRRPWRPSATTSTRSARCRPTRRCSTPPGAPSARACSPSRATTSTTGWEPTATTRTSAPPRAIPRRATTPMTSATGTSSP